MLKEVQNHQLSSHSVIRDVLPTASIKGCVFHFTKAVWWKTQELGLKTTYSQRGAEYRYIRMLMALPFLPAHDIEPAFQLLSDRATSPELRSLVRYLENTWMDNAVWRPRNWSIYRHSIRTNNDVEGMYYFKKCYFNDIMQTLLFLLFL